MTVVVKPLGTPRVKVSWYACLGLCSILIVGCGTQAYQSAPVDSDKARGTLTDVLDSWKGGDTPESLQDLQPPIVVQDFDWAGGIRLQAYEIVDAKPIDANLTAKVKLSLESKSGDKSEKTVTYLVTTAPALTVFRDSMQ